MTQIFLEWFPLFGGILAGALAPVRNRFPALRLASTSLLIGIGWPLLAGEIHPDTLSSTISIALDVLAAAAGVLAMNILFRRPASTP
jgi:predicted tellurium resistance membrane protein TerC